MQRIIRNVLAILFILSFFIAFNAYAGGGAVSMMVASGVSVGCNPAVDEIGDRTEYGEQTDVTASLIYCILYNPSCSGTLATAYIAHYGTGADNVKVAVYLDDGDSSPDAGDSKVADSGAMASGGSDGWKSSAGDLGGSVNTGSNYWLCFIPDSTGWYVKRTTTSAKTLYYNASCIGCYGTVPSDLNRAWTTVASREYSMYVEIE